MDDIESKLKEKLSEDLKPDRIVHTQPISKEKVVFVSTCWHSNGFLDSPLEGESEAMFLNLLKMTPLQSYQIIPAIKDFDIDLDDLTTEDYHFYRDILFEELEGIQPDLIIPLGDVALKSVYKQSGVYNKRGSELFIQSETTSKVISVCPVFSEETVYLEPALRKIFVEDITNYCNKVIYGLNKFKEKGYILCDTVDLALYHLDKCMEADAVGADSETTGLDFKDDKMTCWGGSYEDRTAFIIPLHHFESPFTDSEIKIIVDKLAEVHAHSVPKYYANFKFDAKFLIELGVTEFNECHDIQFMHSMIDENRSHALRSLSIKYYPLEIETY